MEVPAQTPVVGPVGTPGVPGLLYKVNDLDPPLPLQFAAATLIYPEVNVERKLTVIELVPIPLVMLELAGNVQL